MTDIIPIRDIKEYGSLQPRVVMHMDTIAEYKELYTSGTKLPAVDVFLVDGVYYLVDGWHRKHAMEDAGVTEVEATVHTGTLRDAELFSLSVNATHGLRRTNADKERIVRRMLADAEWMRWSNRQIAEHCGVSEGYVRKIRGEPIPAADLGLDADDEVSTESGAHDTHLPSKKPPATTKNKGGRPAKRTGQDGKNYPPSKKPKKEPKSKEPEPVVTYKSKRFTLTASPEMHRKLAEAVEHGDYDDINDAARDAFEQGVDAIS